MIKQTYPATAEEQASADLRGLPRRDFLRYTGAGLALTGLLLTGCSDDDDDQVDPNSNLVNVGTSDIGVLNYAYALEQLEAAFYAQVVAGGTGTYFAGLGASSAERQILTDLALHEKAHRDFFRNTIPAGNIIKELSPDFSAIDFNVGKRAAGAPAGTKLGVLDAAMAFEDLGVAAYNGAGRYITNPVYLALAGKIVSVEARHAALIRDLMSYNTFVDNDVVELFTPTSNTSAPGVGTGTGKERSKRPADVVTVANQFLQTGSKLNVSGLA